MKVKFLAAVAAAFPLISALCCIGAPIAASANSVPTYWEGANASGAIVKGEDCPVIVEKGTLNLNIASLPREGKVELNSYTAEAVAEYTFHNPTNADVDMTLLLPFGIFPSYVEGDAQDKISAVSVDGKAAQCTVRYTYSFAPFDADKAMARVLDEKKTDAFYRKDATVYEYRLVLSSSQDTSEGYFKIKLRYNPQKTRVIFPIEGTRLRVIGGDMYAIAPLSSLRSESAVFYAVGEALAEVTPSIEGGAAENAMTAQLAKVMSFSEFAVQDWQENTGISQIDWYNAIVDMLNEKKGLGGSVADFSMTTQSFLRWYEYGLKIPAGGHIVNRVKAPLYPTIEASKNPRYEYSYLLSPAAKWADFRSLEIRIETPYYLTNGSLDFARSESENGKDFIYLYTRSSLPQGELSFVLTESDGVDGDFSVFDKNNSFLRPSLTWAFITLTVLSGIAGIVVVIVVVSLRKKNKSD